MFATVNFIGPNNGVLMNPTQIRLRRKTPPRHLDELKKSAPNSGRRSKPSTVPKTTSEFNQQAPSPNAPAPTTNNPNNNPSPAPARTPAHSPVIPAGPAPYPDTGAGTQRKTKHAQSRPAPAPAQFSAPHSNQLSDQPQAFNTEDAITTHPAVQNLRNIGGRVVAIEDD